MLLIEGPHPTSMTIGSSTSGSKLGTVKKYVKDVLTAWRPEGARQKGAENQCNNTKNRINIFA